MVDLLLGIKIRADGGPQTVRQIKAIDDQVKSLQEQNRRVANTAAALKDAYNLSDDEVQQLTSQLLKLEQQTQNVGRSARTLREIFQGVLQGFGQQLTQIGFNAFNSVIATLRNGLGSTIQAFIGVEAAIKQAGVISGSVGTPAFEALVEEVERLGIVTSKTPQEIANTAVALSRAGFAASETAAALEGIARASEASGESLETVGDIIAKTVRAFNLTAEESQFVANALVSTANNTNTTINGLGESFQYIASTAAAANQPVDDILVLLGLLGDAGIQGSQAGTNLAQALERLKQASAGAESEFSNLVRGNAKAVQAFELIAADVRNTDGSMKSVLDLLPQIKANLDTLGQADRDLVFKALFGTEGGRAFQTLVNAAPERIAKVTEEVKVLSQAGEGSAVRAGEELLKGLSGAIDLIEGSIGTLQNQAGEALAPALEGAVRLLTDVINRLIEAGDLFTAIQDAGTRFTQALQANPQIAVELAAALGDVARIISEGIAARLNQVAEALQNNPGLVRELAEGFVQAAEQAGRIAGAVFDVAASLASVGATAGGVAGSIFTSLVPTITAVVNVINAAVQAVQPLTNNTQLLEAAFQALLVQMIAVRAVGLASVFGQILGSLTALVGGLGAANASVALLSATSGNAARSSLLLSQSLTGSAAASQAAATGLRSAAAASALTVAKFALVAGAIASVSTALSRFKDGGGDFQDASNAIRTQLIQTQLELKRTADDANLTKASLLGLLPEEPPPTDFLDVVTEKLVGINERITRIIDQVPGLRAALALIPGAGIALDLLPDTTNGEKRVNDLRVSLNELEASVSEVIASGNEFNGVQSQAAVFVQNYDVAIQELEKRLTELDPAEIGTKAYEDFTTSINTNIEALKNEKREFQQQFGLIDSFASLVEQNQNNLTQLATDATNARAKLIEAGSGQDEILKAEKAALEARLQENVRFQEQLKNALEAEILTPQQVEQANQAIIDVEKEIADTRLEIAQVNGQITEAAKSSVNAQVQSLDSLVNANQQALQQIETDALNAKAALLESGGTQEQIAAQEKAALEKRVAENKELLAELQSLSAGGTLNSEEQAKAAEQIAQLEQQLAQDRVTLAQQVVDEQKRAEEERVKAAQEAAKKITDTLKAQRDEQKRIAEEQFGDTQAQQEQEFSDSQREADKAFQDAQQADADAFRRQQETEAKSFQKSQQSDAEAFQQRQQERENAFRQQQEAAAEAFQQRQQEARDKANREFDALAAEVENRIALANASSAQERREIQERIRQEQEAGQQRRTIEQQVLAERGSVLGSAEARGELELSPLEQARADFEARLQEEAKAFADQQQAEREEFEAQQREIEKAFQEQQELEADAFRQQQETAADLFRQQQEAAAEEFAERQRQAERDFQAQQQEAERRFKDEQRRLDEESAQRIAGILERAEQGIAPPALREGGPVEAGKLYQVHKDEFFVPRTDGTILNQQASRQVVREALTVRQVRTLTAPVAISPTAAPVDTRGVEARLDALLREVRASRAVPLPPAQYSLSTPQPMEDAVGLEMARLRYWASRRGL